jgi:hypothetical protein
LDQTASRLLSIRVTAIAAEEIMILVVSVVVVDFFGLIVVILVSVSFACFSSS